MHTLHTYRRWRARCMAWRSFRSACLALSIVMLPKVIIVFERGEFTRATLKEMGQAAAVAVLMVLFNYMQRLRETEASALERRRVFKQHARAPQPPPNPTTKEPEP